MYLMMILNDLWEYFYSTDIYSMKTFSWAYSKQSGNEVMKEGDEKNE